MFRVCLVTVLVGLTAACGGLGGGSDTYSVEEAQQAFEANGFVLVDPPVDPSGTGLNVWESEVVTVLVPESGDQFFVFVGDPDAARDLWEVQAGGGDPRFNEQEGNVRVMAADELRQPDADNVRAALDALAG
jgi:hypothetical protein